MFSNIVVLSIFIVIEQCRSGHVVGVTEDGVVTTTNRDGWSDAKRYVHFVKHFTGIVHGQRKLKVYKKKYPQKSYFDYINATDEAFALTLVRNNQEVWKDEYLQEIRDAEKAAEGGCEGGVLPASIVTPPKSNTQGSDDSSCTTAKSSESEHTDEERAERQVEGGKDNNNGGDGAGTSTSTKILPKFTAQIKGTKKTYLSSGWNKEGKTYYKNMIAMVQNRSNETTTEYKDIWKELHKKTSKQIEEDERRNKLKKRRLNNTDLPPVKNKGIATSDTAIEIGDVDDYC